MKKPKYIEKLYAIVFLSLGVPFIFVGILSYLGFLKPSAHSVVQDPIIMSHVFFLIGLVFCIIQIILWIICIYKNKLHLHLIENGAKIKGTVEKIYILKYISYGKLSPYRIRYSYKYEGNLIVDKSRLIWHKPDVLKGDTVVVYANDRGKSTLQIS